MVPFSKDYFMIQFNKNDGSGYNEETLNYKKLTQCLKDKFPQEYQTYQADQTENQVKIK